MATCSKSICQKRFEGQECPLLDFIKYVMGKLYQKKLIKNLSPIVYYSGIHKLFGKYSGRGQILMFHRVIPKGSAPRVHNHLSLEVSPQKLEEVISFFKQKKYDFISLDELSSWLRVNENNNKKFVVFTFDDGYKDNYEFAYPVFRKHKIPFTIYVTTNFPEKKAVLWWYILENIVLENNTVKYESKQGRGEFNTTTYKQKEFAFNKIRALILAIDEQNLEENLSVFFGRYGYDLYSFNDQMLLDWENIVEMSNDPLVTIGAHTLNHYNLKNLGYEKAFEEIVGSKQLVEEKIGKEVTHFSYPVGLFGEREVEIVANNGYHSATTTKVANIFCEHKNNMFTLPRVSINSIITPIVLTLYVNGFFQGILQKFRKVIC